MDFGDILEQWEQKQQGRRKRAGLSDEERARMLMEQWLESEEAWRNFEKGGEEEESEARYTRSQLRNMPPEEEIDLHGMTRDQALRSLEGFLRDCVKRGKRKVLVVHGKGNHSREGAVLRKTVHDYLCSSPLTGETGHPGRELGGRGATWALLRAKSKKK
jgi:DNA-nicking Smr family endonuclease